MIVDIRTRENIHMVPCRVFDANGLEWRHVVRADTVTGELHQHVLDDGGSYVLDGNQIRVAVIHAAAPLYLHRLRPAGGVEPGGSYPRPARAAGD